MKFALRALVLGLTLATLVGCTQIPYGFRQESEVLPSGMVVQQAHNNRNRDKLQAAGVGARAEFHEWRIGETLRRSWIADVYRLTTP